MEFFMARVLWTKSYINCHCVRWGAKKSQKAFPFKNLGCAHHLPAAQCTGCPFVSNESQGNFYNATIPHQVQ